MKLRKTTKSNLITFTMAVAIFGVLMILKLAGALTNSMQGMLIPICAYVIMALSLNLTVGVMGELSLGHAGFMSVGAFTGATVSMSLTGVLESDVLRFILAALCGAGAAAVMGFLIGLPVLRLKGDYLAIVTLAFGEIIKSIVTCLYVGKDGAGFHFSFESAEAMGMAEDGKVLINGPLGAVGVQRISTYGAGFVMVLLTLAVIFTLVDSRAGRAIMAIRDNRIAAESVGIPITKYKMMAFVVSAALAGAAGVLYALNFSSFTAVKFNYNTSILVLVFVVLGGIGSMRGSIISAALLTVLPELLRSMEKYRMLIYAIVLILVMIVTNNKTAKQFIGKTVSKITSVFVKKSADGKEESSHE